MKTKYEFTLTLTGFDPKNKKPRIITKELSSVMSMNSEISHYHRLEMFKSPKVKKLKEFLAKFDTNHSNPEFKELNLTLKSGAKELKLVTKEKKYNISYKKTDLYYIFHVSLRKYCDGKAAWGLWQFINTAQENKVENLIDVFYENFIYVWRKVLKVHKHSDIKNMKQEDLDKLAKRFRAVHFYEMEHDPRDREVVNDNRNRSFWYMLHGLYEGMGDDNLASILYQLAESKLK